VNSFGTIVDSLSNAITGQIKTAWSGEETAGSALGASPEYAGKKADPLLSDAEKLSKAMRLAYLGEKQGTHGTTGIQVMDKRPRSD
jgi:hypothetical protein